MKSSSLSTSSHLDTIIICTPIFDRFSLYENLITFLSSTGLQCNVEHISSGRILAHICHSGGRFPADAVSTDIGLLEGEHKNHLFKLISFFIIIFPAPYTFRCVAKRSKSQPPKSQTR
jgi:hypothetical protein